LSRRPPTLTALTINKFRRDGELRDGLVRGFGVRVKNGVKSFDFIYTSPLTIKKRVRYSIGPIAEKVKDGELESARDEAMALRKMVREGRDPAAERRADKAKKVVEVEEAEIRTFRAVADVYARRQLAQLKSGSEVKATIEREFFPYWAHKDIAAITPLDVQKRIEALLDAGTPGSARALFATGRTLFNWALTRPEYGLGSSPFARLKAAAIVGRKQPRTRTLTNIELRALWLAAERMAYPFGALVKMLMLTAVRRNEASDADWGEFDLANGVWTIAATRMKGGAAFVVPITADTLALLQSLPRVGAAPFLFVGATGDRALCGFSPLKARLDRLMLDELRALAKARGDDAAAITLAPFVLHDIRRSVRTHLSALPIEERVRELLLAHAQVGMSAIYDQHSYLTEKRRGLELWHARLRTIINPPAPDNVVPLRA
jgi:integrase